MNALTPIPDSPPSKTTSVELSRGLSSLLNVGNSDRLAAEEIASIPVLLAEAKAKLPALHQQATRHSEAEGVMAVIGRRFALFPQPERSEAEWAEWWADYVEALQDIPVGAIEAGLLAWVRRPDAQFLPKPGELRALAMTSPNRDVRAYERARAAVEFQPPKTYEVVDLPAPAPRIMRDDPASAEKSLVRQMMDEFIERQGPRIRPSPVRANHGPVDERGLTAAMREHLARQA